MPMKILLLSLIILSVTSCGLNSDKSSLKFNVAETQVINPIKTATEANEKDLQYLSIKKKLFDSTCIKCHNPDSAVKRKRLDLTSRQNIIDNFDDIIYRMTDAFDMGFDYMPPKGPAVSPELIKELKVWKSDRQFSNLQKTLFETSCLKCHGPTQTRHIDLSSRTVVLKNFDEIIYKMTTAFDENKKPMPPKGKGEPVSAELIKELENWKQNLQVQE